MFKFKKAAALLLIASLTLAAMPLGVFAAPAETANLSIIHVNDRHGRFQMEPYISQMAKDLEAAGNNVLILDAGDSLHGQTPTNLSKGEAMVEIMNAVGYDTMTPGNHDFNFGVDRLLALSKSMDFPVLAANVIDKNGQALFKPYKIFEFDGLKVGVFGLATPETVSKSDPRIVAGLTFGDPATAAADAVASLKAENCDIIVAVTHLGLDNSSVPANRSEALTSVPGIDVVIDGHSHTVLENGKLTNDTLIAQTGAFAENIGVVEIKIENGKKTKSAKLVAIPKEGEEAALASDEKIVAKIADEEAKIEPITGQIVGKTPVLLQGEREFVRVKDTNLADLITDSMRYATEADIAFLTGGNIRASIQAGDIKMGDVLTTLPFSNLLATVQLSGADMIKVLEHGVSAYPEPAGNHIQVSGIRFEFDPEAEPSNRVTKVTMADGSAFDVNKTYTVATIDFITAGGDGYEMMVNAADKTYYQGDAEAFVAYLATNPAISEKTDNRSIPIAPLVQQEAVPAPAPAAPAVAEPVPVAPAVVAAPVKPQPVAASGKYIVKPGDNLTRIANSYGTTWQEIFKLNANIIKNPNYIYPGQEINVPVQLPKAS